MLNTIKKFDTTTLTMLNKIKVTVTAFIFNIRYKVIVTSVFISKRFFINASNHRVFPFIVYGIHF